MLISMVQVVDTPRYATAAIPMVTFTIRSCSSDHRCGGHEAGHVHGPGCGHEAVPHGDHVDYRVVLWAIFTTRTATTATITVPWRLPKEESR
jgi:hypothetical protein